MVLSLIRLLFLLFIVTNISSCSGVNFTQWHFPYMMDVHQGNIISEDKFNQLKVGQSKEQVIYLIGTPLTQFMFDQNRWDFIHQEHKNNKLANTYSVTLFFDSSNHVTRIEKTGILPNE